GVAASSRPERKVGGCGISATRHCSSVRRGTPRPAARRTNGHDRSRLTRRADGPPGCRRPRAHCDDSPYRATHWCYEAAAEWLTACGAELGKPISAWLSQKTNRFPPSPAGLEKRRQGWSSSANTAA